MQKRKKKRGKGQDRHTLFVFLILRGGYLSTLLVYMVVVKRLVSSCCGYCS